MRRIRISQSLCCAGVLLLAFVAEPAGARRTVIDSGVTLELTGYCSPLSSGTSDCAVQAMPFSIDIDGTSYNSFYMNSNGTVSFNSIESQLALQNSFTGFPDPSNYTGPPPADSLADYSAPIFSPFFLDGPGDPTNLQSPTGFDGELVAVTAVSGNSFTTSWFACSVDTLHCGLATVDLIANATFDLNDGGLTDFIITNSTCVSCTPEEDFASGQQNLLITLPGSLPVYTMTLTDLADGFRVDYTYNLAALGDVGLYGFNLPSGLYEVTGPLANRSFLFNAQGQLVNSVPEPGTWMTMLLGFGLAGFALRRGSLRARLA